MASKKSANPNQNLLKMYNRNRCIDVSLSNSNTGQLSTLHKLNIAVLPDCCSFDYSFVRKSKSKVLIQVPYPSPSDFIAYVDDPTVLSSLD